MKNKNTLFVIGNSLAVIFTIIVNSLAVILPINGMSTRELSDAIKNLFVPDGLTFSIWSIIYVLLILFMLYQINEVFIKKKNLEFLERIGFYFMLASLANIVWIFLWHYQQVNLSLLAMIILFVCLLMIYQRLKIGKTKTSFKEKMFIHIPISVYIGWITVATIANVTAFLVVNKVDGLLLGELIWTILVIFVATFITVLIIKNRSDIAYSLVIIWALLGIIIKRFKVNQSLEIAYISGVCIIIIAVTILIMFFYTQRQKSKILKTTQ